MATYKLIQDIEAEDKILGPLTLRQFIFALIAAFFGYLCFLAIAKQTFFLLVIFFPPLFLAGFFAFPFGHDQPTEIWALAKLRYYFKPRRRTWDQSGIKELVTITVPKKIERIYTDGLSQVEVQSRLKALANTIDTRGWAIKNIDLNTYTPSPLNLGNSDRLLDLSTVPDSVPDSPILASDDILDAQNNPLARHFDTMITQSSQKYRQKLVAQMNSASTTPGKVLPTPDSTWFFMGGGSGAGPAPQAAADDKALSASIHAKSASRKASYGNLRTLQPLSGQTSQPRATQPTAAQSVATQSVPAVTAQPHPAILALANNNDLSVSTIAREAEKAKSNRSGSQEVVISLH